MTVLITGGAGFIGTHLTRELLKQGEQVVCVDNFTLGKRENTLQFSQNYPNYELIECDASQISQLEKVFASHQISTVYHLAANSDIQKSSAEPGIDEKNTFSTTYAVLECMRRARVKRLFFASTSAVYGDKAGELLREDTGSLAPISYYGSAKLASEAFIQSYAYMNDFSVMIFRFPNVIGPDLTHGVIFDFIRKLKKDPTHLQILGDGSQNKPYLYVVDLVRAIVQFTRSMQENNVEIYNIGVGTSTTVRSIADMVCDAMGLPNVRYDFTGGNRGWKGDVNAFQYDLSKIYETGWRPAHTSDESVRDTLAHVDFDKV